MKQETTKLRVMMDERDDLIEQVNEFGELSADNAEQAYSLLNRLIYQKNAINRARASQFYKDADDVYSRMQSGVSTPQAILADFLREFALHCVMYACEEAQDAAENIVDTIPCYYEQ